VSYVALEFLCGLVLARILKASSFGAYAFVMACVGLLAVPAAAGFDRLLIREVSRMTAGREWGLLRGLLRHANLVAVPLATSLALALAAASHWLVAKRSPELAQTLIAGSLLVPIVAFARVRQATLQGLGHVALGQVPEMLVQPATVLLLAIAAHQLLGLPQTGAQAIMLQVIGAAIACGIGVAWLRRLLPAEVGEAPIRMRRTEWTRSSLPFIWLLGLTVVLMNIDTVMIGLLETSADAGIYRTASQMAAFVAFPLTAANMVAAPAIAVLYGGRDDRGLQLRVRQASRVALVGAVPIAAALIAFGNPVLAMFGPEFTSGYRSLVILTLGYLVNASMGVAGYVLIMTRFERVAATCFMVAVALDLALNALLIPRWGIEGAATATCVSLIVLSVLMNREVRRRTGVGASAFARPVSRTEPRR
jgi:LPXTG-motif cell wall-anchored protein